MKEIDVLDFLASNNDQALLVTGHDNAVEGVLVRSNKKPVAVYSIVKIIENLIGMGMCEFDAQEYFEYNIRGSFVGDDGPVFISDD
jgi:hypothetical protein